MGKIAYNFPFFAVLCYGMGCVGMYLVFVIRDICRFIMQGSIIDGLWTTLVLGSAFAFVVAGYRVIDTTLDRLLSNSLIYFGASICCWISHFGAPFIGRVPKSFSFRSDFVALFMIALGLLVMHFVFGYIAGRLEKYVQNR